jgi:plasmid segregation protein ParM
MELLDVGLDLGFSYVKAVANNNTQVVFKSLATPTSTQLFGNTGVGVDEEGDFDPKSAKNNLEVHYGDKKFYVGNYALEQSRNADSLITSDRVGTIQELILGLTAIGLISNTKNIEVSGLMLGLPITELKMAEKLKNVFSGTHKIKLHDRVNGSTTKKVINIKNVSVIQQSVAALYSKVFNLSGNPKKDNAEKMRGKVGIVDIGYRTTDLVGTKKLRLSNHLSDTMEIGISNVFEHIKSYLKSKYNFERNLSQIEEYVNMGYIMLDGEKVDLIPIIEKQKEKIIEQINNKIKTLWRDEIREFSALYLAGGGSVLLQKQLENKFSSAELIEEPQMANAKGYLAYLNVQKNLEKKQKQQKRQTI